MGYEAADCVDMHLVKLKYYAQRIDAASRENTNIHDLPGKKLDIAIQTYPWNQVLNPKRHHSPSPEMLK